jgi:serine protease
MNMIGFSQGRYRLLLAALLAIGLSAPIAANDAGSRTPRVDLGAISSAKQFDRFIVKYRAGSPEARSTAQLSKSLDLAAIRTREQIQKTASAGSAAAQSWLLDHLRRMSLGADVVKTTKKLDRMQAILLMRQIAANANVEYVEIDQTLHAVLTPNDTEYSNQWSVVDADAGIRADKAWDLGSGAGVVVAVIDTGITNHSDLNANVLPGYDFITDVASANDGNGRDADASDPGDSDGVDASSWHGTHVAGTIAAIANNAKGVAGVAFNAKVVPVRVLGIGGGAGSDIADAIIWASGGAVAGVPANANPAEVINLSLGGGGGCSTTYQNAINAAVGNGAVVVVAAGNESIDTANGSLASCNNVIVAGSNTSTSARSSFSNYGAKVDVSAPGSSIISTINTGVSSPAAEGYAYYSGTSMATPHVAAAAALVQARRVAQGFAPYAPADVETQLKKTAYPMKLGCVGVSGAGIIDARTLLDVSGNAFRLLANGVAAGSLSASTGDDLNFAMVALDGATGLNFASSGGSGNVDLYVRFGTPPTTAVYDCRSNAAGNVEGCNIASALSGTYYAMLHATSAFSAVSLTGSGSGNLKPLPDFNVNSSGLTANFTDTSTDPDGSVASRKWNFGDSTISTVANPTKNYAMAGAYMVQLSSTDNSGATRCTLREVAVNPLPVALSNGVTVTGLAAKIGGELRYTLAVPAGASGLSFITGSGSGDADLYVKFGSPPTLSSYDCASFSPTTAETCNIANAQVGTYYVLVHAFSDISGVTLRGSFNGGTGNVAPSANFTFSTNGLTANFTDTSTDSDGSIASRSWNFGDGGTSTATNPSKTYASAGTYTVQLTVTDNGGLTGTVSKSVTVSTAPAVSLSIADVSVTEGNSGTKLATFRVRLSAAAGVPVTYNIATANGTATAGSDYVAKSLSGQSIAAGSLTKTFTVTINGDTTIEANETFTVTVSNVIGASVSDGQAIGTITNEDCICLSIANVTIAEGNSGSKQAVFTVILSRAAAGNVSYNIATANSTALTTDNDYVASSLTGQSIPAGQLSKTFNVTINGDTKVETNERFKVNISNVVGATVSDAQALGTIANDD